MPHSTANPPKKPTVLPQHQSRHKPDNADNTPLSKTTTIFYRSAKFLASERCFVLG